MCSFYKSTFFQEGEKKKKGKKSKRLQEGRTKDMSGIESETSDKKEKRKQESQQNDDIKPETALSVVKAATTSRIVPSPTRRPNKHHASTMHKETLERERERKTAVEWAPPTLLLVKLIPFYPEF